LLITEIHGKFLQIYMMISTICEENINQNL